MIRRLLLGLFEGALISAALIAGLVYGLHVTSWTAAFAYLAAALAGILVGLIAGKPIWAKGAKIEAGLKAVFGAGLGILGMYAARRWLSMPVDLGFFSQGEMPLGEIPAASIALVVTTIAVFYELDNTSSGDHTDASRPSKRRLAASSSAATADTPELEPNEDEQAASRKRKR